VVNICNEGIFVNVSNAGTKEQTQTNKETKNNMSTNNKLKVLVFDDTEAHRLSAKLLLSGNYDLTVVGTYDEARKALSSVRDYELSKRLFSEKYTGSPYEQHPDREQRIAYDRECDEKATTHPDFDVVLTDLLVPASRDAQGDKGMKFVGQEMPLGTTIALQALIMGIKNVAVVTDMNHHHHPASAAFDGLGSKTCKLEGVNIICTNHVECVAIDTETQELVSDEFVDSPEGKVKYPGDWSNRQGLVYGKDWKRVLDKLTGKPEETKPTVSFE